VLLVERVDVVSMVERVDVVSMNERVDVVRQDSHYLLKGLTLKGKVETVYVA
jgi:hypothetical protein